MSKQHFIIKIIYINLLCVIILTSCSNTHNYYDEKPIPQYKLELRDENNNYYKSNFLPLDFSNKNHIFSFLNFNNYDLDISFFVIINGSVVPFRVGDSEVMLFANSCVPAEAQTDYNIRLEVDANEMKYETNQFDIITVINSSKENIDTFIADDFFVGDCRFFFVNDNSKETLSCLSNSEHVIKKTEKQAKVFQGRGGCISTIEDMSEFVLTSTVNGEFAVSFSITQNGLYSYFLVEQYKGVIQTEDENNIIYLTHEDLLQRRYTLDNGTKGESIYFVVVVPLFIDNSLAFSTQRVLYN